jgi:hypothetical protein
MERFKHRHLPGYCLLLCSLALIVAPCISMPAPAQAGRLIWSTVETPGTAFSVIASPSEISDLAVSSDGRTLYSVDTANGRVYRSDDAGASWNDLTNYLVTSGAAMPAWQIAMAPDNARFLAAVTSSGGMPRNIFVSADGGQTWSNTNFPAGANISSLSISPFNGNYDIAAGTRSGGAGSIYNYKASGMGGVWMAQGFNGDVLSLKFSPSYRSDASIAVLYSTAAGTYFNVGIRDMSANTTGWTNIYSGNTPEVTVSGTGASAKAAQVIKGDLELPADFSGQAPSLCRAYISMDASGGSAGIFRVDNSMVFQMQSGRRISSISYIGTYLNGKLLAGEVTGDSARATVLTWYTDAPMTCPATCWYQSEKSPTGAGTSGYGNAQVSWSPDGGRAYCGTSSALLSSPAAWPSAYTSGTALDESALSVSRDNGHNWDQLSLIDTQINFLSDVAVTIDSYTIYLASINTAGAGFDSIWRSSAQSSSKSWERVLCYASNSNDIILRTNNYSNDQAVFAASRNTDDLRQSQDGGLTWKAQLPGMAVTDFSVTSLNNVRYVFVLGSNGMERKGNASSLITQWTSQVATTLVSGHSIFAAPNGVIVAGGGANDNRVAVSGDGGASFSVTSPLPVAGSVHAIADYRMGNAAIIYAATDTPGSDIYNLAGPGTWNFMGAPSTGFWALAQMGTLYGDSSAAGGPAVVRTLAPELLGPPAIEWDVLNAGLTGGVLFTREPVGLKLSSGVNLWAVDNRPYNPALNTGRLWTFCDCLSPSPQYAPPSTPSSPSTPSAPAAPAIPPREVLFAAPVPYAPQPDDLIPIYINDNSIGEITFKWKPRTTAIAYELWLAADADFSKVILKKVIGVENRRAPAWTMTDKKGIAPGNTYYWKVRIVQAATGEKGEGDWSETFPFTVAENTVKKPVSQPAVIVPTDNKTRPASENKTKPASGRPDIFNELWFWQLGAVLFIFCIASIIILLVVRRQRNRL